MSRWLFGRSHPTTVAVADPMNHTAYAQSQHRAPVFIIVLISSPGMSISCTNKRCFAYNLYSLNRERLFF